MALALAGAFWIKSTAAGAEGEAIDYLRDLKPLLKQRCYACHGALKQKGGLRLDTAAGLLAGGDDGTVVLPGKPDESRLLARLTTDDPEKRMPREAAPLKPDQIAAIRAWIGAGAPAPDAEQGEDDPRDHWSFRPIEKPPVPAVSAAGGNAIDAFLEAKRAPLSLKAQPEAGRTLLLRRVYLDLTGLPPSAEQLHDERPYETIVDELLESPAHGERWGRHWMDVWRYSDWYGLGAQLRNSQKHLWHWRDWIVESLNADKGYDRMIQEMLAGDELAPGDAATVRATGFLARSYYLFNRTTWLDETIEHTGKAFLGLTLNCAKCHDHKYDPIDMNDYYRLRAVFEPHQARLDAVPGEPDPEKDGLPRVFDDHPGAETLFHIRGDPANPDREKKIEPGVPALLASFAPAIEPVSLPESEWAPGRRDFVRRDRLDRAETAVETARRNLASAGGKAAVEEAKVAAAEAELAALRAAIAADDALETPDRDTRAREASRREGESVAAKARLEILSLETSESKDEKKLKAARDTLAKAEKKTADPKDLAYPPVRGTQKALEGPADKPDTFPATFARVSTGRRLMLARWITSPENPLTARVAVNHVWMRHFGEPLVETVSDFGRQAPEPPLRELLDYLAAEFMASGWSLRHLHRLMVTSRAYRMTSDSAGADAATLAADPGNRHYWRANARRMEAQAVRDSLLSLAGTLDRRLGGPSLDPKSPSSRRGLYFKHSRDDQDAFLSMFDDADHLQCYRRGESIVPQQALALSNSRLSLEQAEKIALRIASTASGADRAAFIETAFETLLARPPQPAERDACEAFWTEMAVLDEVRAAKDPEARVRARLVHGLLNHNDFITVR